MPEPTNTPSISDASTPSAGRIYDYMLGGHHNFEIDRQAADGLIKQVPEMPQWVRLIRWFLGAAVRSMIDDGFSKFLDFASGLPTVDHIHQIAPKGTKVVYSDVDPVTVAYAQEIVKGLPEVAFVLGDARRPESILDLDVVKRLFGSDHRLAIGFNGIAWFLEDKDIMHALDVLYDWASPGAKLFICDTNVNVVTSSTDKIAEFYKQVRQPVFLRSVEQFESLFGRWTIQEPGVQPLEAWLPIDRSGIEKTTRRTGGNLIGAILEKR